MPAPRPHPRRSPRRPGPWSAIILASTLACSPAQTPQQIADELDATAWQAEVAAAPYTAAITAFWDRLSQSPDRLLALASAPAQSVSIPATSNPGTSLPLGITRIDYDSSAWKSFPADELTGTLRDYSFDGWSVDQTTWHHTIFRPSTNAAAASSRVTFEIGASNALLELRALLRGELDLEWSASTPPVATSAQVSRLTVFKRKGAPAFSPFMRIAPPSQLPGAHVTIAPVIVTDIDGDGRSEIINGGTNGILYNRGDGNFESSRLFDFPIYLHRPGLVADFTGDAKPDFLGATDAGKLALFDGARGIPFPDPYTTCWDGPALEATSVITAGDVDGDGDLDLWIGQHKSPYVDGNFPTPYYDATDGFPSFLLLNDGTGTFSDNTVAAGLAFKHRRRVSSASLVDLDGDRDLDLVTVSDFAGIDAYLNDGKGRFTDVTEERFPTRNQFGMSHTLADFNRDGRIDLFAVGRSSVAADRMAALGLQGPAAFPKINAPRAAMASGNRLFLATPGATFPDSGNTSAIAKTGWPGDVASFDFDNDADLDLFVANGYVTGASSHDYDSDFWRHDIYLGKSRTTQELEDFFSSRLADVRSGEISWGGVQTNVLAIDTGDGEFLDIAYLMGISHRYDSRSTIAEDFNNDGTVDLAVLHNRWADRRTTLFQRLALYLNNLRTDNHWISVSLHSDVPGVPTIGATITATVDGTSRVHHVVTGDGYRCQSPAAAHFGLGQAGAVDSVTVRWPGGLESVLTNPQIDTRHVVRPPR